MDAKLTTGAAAFITTIMVTMCVATAAERGANRSTKPLLDPPSRTPRTISVAEDAKPTEVSSDKNTVYERHPNGAPRVMRQVTQDAVGNYVNHGEWKYWDPQGNVIAQGEFQFGKKRGEWARLYQRCESPLFDTPAFRAFQTPFTSQATFKNGNLHGEWIFVDADQHIVCRWKFVDGQRDGPSIWYYKEGMKRRQITFVAGQLEGPYREWGLNGMLTRDDQFTQSRQLETRLITDKDTDKVLAKGQFLQPQLIMKTPDNWWNALPAAYVSQGEGVRHGKWISWHSNGEIKQQVDYEMGQLSGKFIVWHPSGELAIDGSYHYGKAVGEWTWRHPNGLKKSQGEFVSGTPRGEWSWWTADGRLAECVDYSKKRLKPKEIARLLPDQRRSQHKPRVALGAPPIFD